jgi:acyl carrier protein
MHHCPDLEYLLSVLRQAVRVLRQNGKISIGNILHLGLLPALHGAIQLKKAPATINVTQLRKRIARAIAEERRLAIHPDFFELLPSFIPGISAVDAQWSDHGSSELSRYHYDVILHTGQDCARCEVSLPTIPNSRLEREIETQRLIQTSDEHLEVGTLQARLSQRGKLDTRLSDPTRPDQFPRSEPQPAMPRQALHAFINSPLHTGLGPQLIPQLREQLKKTLPQYMIPSHWVMISQIPLTQNGKVDRNALPRPEDLAKNPGEYVAPRTPLECTLVDIWKQVLSVDHLGVQDNFLDLGGHSLLAMSLVARAARLLSVELSVVDVLQFPTVEGMAEFIESHPSTADYEEGVI